MLGLKERGGENNQASCSSSHSFPSETLTDEEIQHKELACASQEQRLRASQSRGQVGGQAGAWEPGTGGQDETHRLEPCQQPAREGRLPEHGAARQPPH